MANSAAEPNNGMGGTRPPVQIGLEADPTVNFAMQQNDVPLVKALRLANGSAAALRDIAVRIWGEPGFVAPWTGHVSEIGPGGTCPVNTADLALSAQCLMNLTESVAGLLHAEVSAGGRILARHVQKVEVLATDQWSGLRSLPEILAAFVLPNHPAVQKVLADAAVVLRDWTGDPSLTGYQTRSRERVLRMAAAAFSAISRLGLTYTMPPASFEQEGQRIRLPDRILENRMGTCLDLTLLLAGCLEQAGLHPLVVFTEGHAFGGVWLEEECFVDTATDDLARLRKRVDLGEISVFESTLLTHPGATFEQAVSEARRKLDVEPDFRCVIDIQRARKSRIRPLPGRGDDGGPQVAAGTGVGQPATDVAPPTLALPGQPALETGQDKEEEPETPATRLDRWKRRLLDLTLHNRLINFRETKKCLPLLCPDLVGLEDALANGDRFSILPRPPEMEAAELRSDEVHRRRTGENLFDGLLREELKAKRLHVNLPKDELDRRLVEVYRAARLSLEEGGANTLYLALGFLAWYQTTSSDQRRTAPILLIPMELERRSVQEGFRTLQSDEDAMVNMTLLELLERDFQLRIPGMDPVPEDKNGIDVAGILAAFRRAIKDIDRWDVLEEACIGQFSFTKFLMWSDLRARTEDLLRNKVVSHLVYRPNEPFPVEGAFPDPDRLDETHRAEETFCPLLSDSSQLAAVHAAAEGKSFVLEGPPGTGKSQTITNLIAHSLSLGKTVLFVSEKMAALNVVHSRLRQCGLDRFCLELHSNKSHKLEVIQQLGRALERVESRSPEDWSRETRRLESLRRELNQYVEAVHRARSFGESVFQATSKLIGLRDVLKADLAWPSPEEVNAEALEGLGELVERLQTAAEASGHPAEHVWSAAACRDWNPALQREVEKGLEQLDRCCAELEAAADAAGPHLHLGQEGWGLQRHDFCHSLAELALSSPGPTASILSEPDWPSAAAVVDACMDHGRQRDDLRRNLYERYTEQILSLDLDGLRRTLDAAEQSWPPVSWWKRFSVRWALRKVSRPGQRPVRALMAEDLELAQALRRHGQAVSGAGEKARQLLGAGWRDGEADWNSVQRIRDWSDRFHRLTGQVGKGEPSQVADFRQRLAKLLVDEKASLETAGKAGRPLADYCAAWRRFQEAREHLEKLLRLDPCEAWGSPDEPDAAQRMLARVRLWQQNLDSLYAWCHWQAVRAEAVERNLGPLLADYEQNAWPTADLPTVFERSFYEWWVAAVTEADGALRGFYRPEHERKIQKFCQLDERYLQLTLEAIQAKLAARTPVAADRVSENSELGILQRELQKRRRHIPVRQLFQRIPHLLPRLKPCLLMSPLSVAQYLDPSHPPFDLVVFDEASQIPVWDAVGAIARGREAAIVGDPKQLPPTSFFARSEEQEWVDEDLVEDLESILDDCIGARVPWLQLRWHYRSRHESLIAFSNYSYYDNRLLTFPSPHTGSQGVQWRPVPEGVYDKGRSRTNRSEAEAVVAEVCRRLRDPELARYSIGVVTFSIPQQTLVEDLLDEARAEHPEIEPFFSPEAPEPVFVKNLENVQGDERDAILFSVCYGPDTEGRVSMNFGPLNRDGGERRLNVAITRARREVLVFSTMRAEQIDLARTRARGVQDLKLFLEYAERGQSALREAIRLRQPEAFDSPFEQQVHDALVERGHEVHTQVGCSGYRIDLAVVDPERPGRYLLGIECDGVNYHRAKTARDRDRLRASVLQGLGWQLHRVWSTDWWHHPSETLAGIEKAIEKARQGQDSDTAATRAPETRPQPPPAAPPPPAPADDPPAPEPPKESPELPVYSPFPCEGIGPPTQDFYESGATRRIRSLLESVVQHEGPVSLDLAARRVADCWQMGRVTENVLERIKKLARRSSVRVVEHGGQTFFWPPGLDPQQYAAFRVPGAEEGSRREAEDLPPEEVANAAHHVLQRQISLPKADLIFETARLFGYQRRGRIVDERTAAGIDILVARGLARLQGEQVVLG
jgi:very-short-patch-repair endonuclease